jgi:fatty acid desaturase
MNNELEATDFPIKEARSLVKDLMTPKESIYWIDYLFHIILGWGAFWYASTTAMFTPLWFVAYVVSSVAIYRAVIFTHELAHLKKGTFKLFRFVWNLTVGFVIMAPSFTYHGVHNDHHARDVYGTNDDGEYLPFAAGPPWKIISYVSLSFILPFLIVIRSMLLTPLGMIIPPLGRLVWQRASSLTIDMNYKRRPMGKSDDPTSHLQEVMASLYGWLAVFAVLQGWIPIQALLMWYMVTVLAFILNSIRTLCAHAYRNSGEDKMTLSEQFLDGVDVPGNMFTTFWAPVGLRYHATHHLFPNMPYHSLGEAHRRLKSELSDNSLYLASSRRGMWDALTRLWADAVASQKTKL